MQRPAQAALYVHHREVTLGVQRKQDLPVAGPDCRRIAECEAEAIWQADVVDNLGECARRQFGPDRVLHAGEELFRFLDSRALRPAYMKAHLPGVDGREEIGADKCHQQHRPAYEDAINRRNPCTVVQAPAKRPGVSGAHALKPDVEHVMRLPN